MTGGSTGDQISARVPKKTPCPRKDRQLGIPYGNPTAGIRVGNERGEYPGGKSRGKKWDIKGKTGCRCQLSWENSVKHLGVFPVERRKEKLENQTRGQKRVLGGKN